MLAYLGLGSNLGDRAAQLCAGLDALEGLGEVLAVSPVYETEPVGGPAGQPAYLNLVARVHTDLTPQQLLAQALAIEQAAGRVRSVRFGPRTLDVDLLLLDDLVIDEPALSIPHPRMAERAFVLAPLEDLDASLVPARWREPLGGPGAVSRSVRKVLVAEPRRAPASSGQQHRGWRLVPVAGAGPDGPS